MSASTGVLTTFLVIHYVVDSDDGFDGLPFPHTVFPHYKSTPAAVVGKIETRYLFAAQL